MTTRAPRPRPIFGRRRAPQPLPETPVEAGTPTHCPYCALQCGMAVVADQAGGAPTIAARDFPTNAGGLCRKGWTSAMLLGHPERLTTPLMRVGHDGPLSPTTWPKAIQRTAQAFVAAQRAYGPEAAGVFGGGGLTLSGSGVPCAVDLMRVPDAIAVAR